MKTTALLFTLFFVIIAVQYVSSEPGFNGTAPGCSGSGCHTLQTGIVTATLLSNNQVRITVSGTTSRVAGELVNSGGTVVASVNSTSSNPFILTAPAAGSYTVNAGFNSPSRQWGTTTVNIASAPNAPTALSAIVVNSPLSVSLNWTDNSSDEQGFIIERETVTDAFEVIDTTAANAVNYQDLTVTINSYNYRIKAFNAAGSSSYSNTAGVIVPVEITSFTAEALPGRILLRWQTATELDNKGFDIERKSPGSAVWQNVGFAEGKGTTTEITDYVFSDAPGIAGKYSYRLKQIDFSGRYEYSGSIEAKLDAPEVFSLAQNHPNPFNPSTVLEYTVPRQARVSIIIYNALGNETACLFDNVQNAGTYKITFNASGLPSGMYFCRLSTAGFQQTRKLLLLK